ncbi:MAG: mechanosensitive ion channel family protein [Planctomycetota bacterium]
MLMFQEPGSSDTQGPVPQGPIPADQSAGELQGPALEPSNQWLDAAEAIGIVLLAWIVALIISRLILVWSMTRISGRTKATWDDLIVERRVPHHLSHAVPFLVSYFVARSYADGFEKSRSEVPIGPTPDEVQTLPSWIPWVEQISLAAVWAVMVWTLHAALSAIHELYMRRQDEQRRPIKGYIQLARLVVTVAGSLLALASLLGQDLSALLAGIGVSTAIVLLVFKDTLTSLVASISLTANDTVRVGDWIEMPAAGADGDVIDVALHMVKVRNWDKTITTIPINDLYAKTFKNWRGMSESGGRRIKRSIKLDINSVRFLDEADFERLEKIGILKGYLNGKKKELEEYNRHRNQDEQRRLTNMGTFRAYVARYLHSHPEINKAMTLLVRQLDPTTEGVPIEIYAFTSTTAWGDYERIQADIFEHLFAIAPAFDLRVFQRPTGLDLERAGVPGESV